MTEPHFRDLFVWIEAHRKALIDHAGELAEIAANTRDKKAASRCQLIAMELAAAISVLDRVHPPDPESSEDTVPDGLPPPRPSKSRLTGGPA